MDRQRIDGGVKKATITIKEKAGQIVGDRHRENEGNAERTEDHGKAMDAVREVVEKESTRSEDRTKSGVDKAMDAVREVVEEE